MRESKLYNKTTTYQSKYDDILKGNVTINGVVVQKNNVTRVIDKAIAPAAYTQRDQVTGQSGQAEGTLTDVLYKTQIGRYQVGSSANSFLDSKYVSAATNEISNAARTAMTSLGSGVSGVAGGVGNSTAFVSKKIGGYVAPVLETMHTIEGIGEEFDKMISETFLAQMFKIKGSEILCAMFCLLVSFLSCKQRSDLADAVNAVKKGLTTTASISGSIGDVTRDPVEIPLFNDKTMMDNVKSLFPDNIKKDRLNSSLNIPQGTETRKQSVSLAIPPSVNDTIKKLISILNILGKGQITLPTGITGDIWGFSQAVMALVRDVLMVAVDNFLTKIVKSVEEKLKSIVPQMCVGNLAAKFINRITEALNTLKNYFLDMLRGMLGDAKGFGIKYTTFGWYFKEIMDLLAMLNALSLILGRFAELALLCGISKCNELPSKDMKDIQDSIRAGLSINETNEPARIITNLAPRNKSLDDLAAVFKSATGQPDVYIAQNTSGGNTSGEGSATGTNSFQVILPDMFKDVPSQIADIINSKAFLGSLGGAYSVYPQATSGVSIVYTYELKC